MATEVRMKCIVLPGGNIEVGKPDLIPGKRATVIVTIEENEQVEQRHVIDMLLALPSHQLFENAEEVDAYLREERDSWGS